MANLVIDVIKQNCQVYDPGCKGLDHLGKLVRVQSLLLRCPLRPVGVFLFYVMHIELRSYKLQSNKLLLIYSIKGFNPPVGTDL